jgi:hypothetical protein
MKQFFATSLLVASLVGYSSAVHLRPVEDDVDEEWTSEKIINLGLAETAADSIVNQSDTTIITETIYKLSQEDQS